MQLIFCILNFDIQLLMFVGSTASLVGTNQFLFKYEKTVKHIDGQGSKNTYGQYKNSSKLDF